MEKEHCYVAIDLKSFYASVECRERGLDPLMTPEPSIGSLVRSYLLAALGMHKNYGGE